MKKPRESLTTIGVLPSARHVVVGARDRLLARLLAPDDLDQLHLVHRREEVQADEALGMRACGGEAGDRQGRGVASRRRRRERASARPRVTFGLERAALEHRLDDQVAAVERTRIGGGRHEREQASLRAWHQGQHGGTCPEVTLRIAATPAWALSSETSFSTQAMPRAAFACAMPAPIMPAPRTPTLRRPPGREALRARLAGADRVEIEEERLDHVLGGLADHDMGELSASMRAPAEIDPGASTIASRIACGAG